MRTHLRYLSAVALAGLIGLACADGVTPLDDRALVAATIQDQLGSMMSDSGSGEVGAVATGAGAASASFSASSTDSVGAPRFWGRIRIVPGGPRPVIERDVVITGDTARATLTVHFQGVFLVDTSADSVFDPTSKPLQEYFTQHAVLVRDACSSPAKR